jgi:hypothetical protein
MTDKERAKLGLVKELKYRYALASGDFNFLGEEENTNYLRALAHLGVRMDNGENDKYFTPESIAELKKKEKDSNYKTNLVNPIYISDFQAPLEVAEIETTGGGPIYDDQDRLIGNEPIVETKKVIKPAEKRLTPPDVILGLEGAGGTADPTIPPAGTDNSIKKIKASNLYYTSSRENGSVPAKFEVKIKVGDVFQEFTFDRFGYITVLGIKYSVLQVLNEFDDKPALNYWREQLKGDTEANTVMDSWGFSETTTQPPVKTEGDGERDSPQAEEGEEQQENKTEEQVATSTANSSLMEKINVFRGFKVKDGQVQKDKKGNPIIVDKTPQLDVDKNAEITIDANGAVSIKGNVTINAPTKSDPVKLVENGKFTIPFGAIEGSFRCSRAGLTTLVGSPKVVKGKFDCSNNQLTSLAGSPDEVSMFIASDNKSLTSLSGGPKKITGITDTSKSQTEYIYDVSACALTSLDGNGITTFGPGGFNCGGNKITSLTGLGVVSTTGVTKFDCSNNELTSLNGIPKPIKDAKTGKPGDYWIRNNVSVTVFPASMADFEVNNFEAGGLSLTSLSFAPKKVYGSFNCVGNKGSKKLTNQSIGFDRFKKGGGFEEDAGNRIVAIDIEFITSEGSWNNKTYDINTTFKKPEFATVDTGFESTASGKLIKHGGATWTEIPDPSTIKVLYKITGEYQKPGGGIQFEFECFRPIGMPGPDSYNRSWVAAYAKGRKSPFQRPLPNGQTGFRSWEMEFPNIKNYINWSMFESGGEGWGWAQPTGALIVNGVNYGGKTVEAFRKYASMFWIDSSGPHLGRGSDIYKDGGDYKTDAVKSINNSKHIRYSAPGSALAIDDGKVSSWTPEQLAKLGLASGTSFIGHLKNGTWFAGTTGVPDPGQIAAAIQSYYKGNVKNLGVSDGSASRQCFINGEKLSAPGRPVSVALAW